MAAHHLHTVLSAQLSSDQPEAVCTQSATAIDGPGANPMMPPISQAPSTPFDVATFALTCFEDVSGSDSDATACPGDTALQRLHLAAGDDVIITYGPGLLPPAIAGCHHQAADHDADSDAWGSTPSPGMTDDAWFPSPTASTKSKDPTLSPDSRHPQQDSPGLCPPAADHHNTQCLNRLSTDNLSGRQVTRKLVLQTPDEPTDPHATNHHQQATTTPLYPHASSHARLPGREAVISPLGYKDIHDDADGDADAAGDDGGDDGGELDESPVVITGLWQLGPEGWAVKGKPSQLMSDGSLVGRHKRQVITAAGPPYDHRRKRQAPKQAGTHAAVHHKKSKQQHRVDGTAGPKAKRLPVLPLQLAPATSNHINDNKLESLADVALSLLHDFNAAVETTAGEHHRQSGDSEANSDDSTPNGGWSIAIYAVSSSTLSRVASAKLLHSAASQGLMSVSSTHSDDDGGDGNCGDNDGFVAGDDGVRHSNSPCVEGNPTAAEDDMQCVSSALMQLAEAASTVMESEHDHKSTHGHARHKIRKLNGANGVVSHASSTAFAKGKKARGRQMVRSNSCLQRHTEEEDGAVAVPIAAIADDLMTARLAISASVCELYTAPSICDGQGVDQPCVPCSPVSSQQEAARSPVTEGQTAVPMDSSKQLLSSNSQTTHGGTMLHCDYNKDDKQQPKAWDVPLQVAPVHFSDWLASAARVSQVC
eukprot:jgi/Chrzof1/2748/Cz11g27220.t1